MFKNTTILDSKVTSLSTKPSYRKLLLFLFLSLKTKAQAQNDSNCSLQCENGGACILPHVANIDSINTKPLEICDCAENYGGYLCQLKKEYCNEEKDFYCYGHGSCGSSNRCDCDQVEGFTIYSGVHCEHAATNLCHSGGLEKAKETSAFCANEGKCIKILNDDDYYHEGCECLPGWTGDHCEFRLIGNDGVVSGGSSSSVNHNSELRNILMLSFVCIACLVIIVSLVRKWLPIYLLIKEAERIDSPKYASRESNNESTTGPATSSFSSNENEIPTHDDGNAVRMRAIELLEVDAKSYTSFRRDANNDEDMSMLTTETSKSRRSTGSKKKRDVDELLQYI